MKKPPGFELSLKSVLSISPVEEDHTSLKGILNRADECRLTTASWTVQPSFCLSSVIPVLRQRQFSIIVSERDLSPGTWRQALAAINELVCPPLLIVTSRLADDRLWSEVLNLGGWDVLAKPFNVEEVWRVFDSAWLHWKHNAQSRQTQPTHLRLAAAG